MTIGIVDTGVSLDHPSLLTTSTGERKVVEWVTGTDPLTDGDPTWINMAAQVSGANFVFRRRSTTPHRRPARTASAIFNESHAGLRRRVQRRRTRHALPAADLNRDGTSRVFGVLWNTTTNQVWVDTDRNDSFADETAMTDYKVNFDVG